MLAYDFYFKGFATVQFLHMAFVFNGFIIVLM